MNPERSREKQRQRRQENLEKSLERERLSREKHKEMRRARDRERRQRDPDRFRGNYRRWRESHREQELVRLATRRALMTNDPVLKLFVADLRTMPCTYCGATGNITVDHVVPLSRGGSHEATNLVPACYSCNSSKGAKLLDEWDHGEPDVP